MTQTYTLNWPKGFITEELKQAFNALDNNCRLVGGCVRDAILGETATDIDICTPLLPEDVIKKLKAAGFDAIPTGLDHGTITAVKKGINFKAEITTLRKDVSTDGRRATVAFSDSYTDDALRRDFTVNALRADLNGNIEDDVNGYTDLKAGKIKFIGDAETRLKEDWLRALRFVRFFARYSAEEIDENTLKALHTAHSHMADLSKERKTEELYKLLMQDTWQEGLNTLEDTGLTEALALPLSAECHTRLNWYLSFYPEATAEERFFALTFDLDKQALDNPHFLFTSTIKKLIGTCPKEQVDFFKISDAEHLAALLGTDIIIRWLALRFGAWETSGEESSFIEDKINMLRTWEAPTFPVDGHDVMALGLTGADIGIHLTALKHWWAFNGYPEKEACLEKLHEQLKQQEEHAHHHCTHSGCDDH